MLQDDVAVLADVVKNSSEQLQQVQRQFQLQLAEQQVAIIEQQAVITEQARQIDALTKNGVKQGQQVDRLTANFARLEIEHKVIAALQDNGTGCCTSALLRPFDTVFCVNCHKFNVIARSLSLPCRAQEY